MPDILKKYKQNRLISNAGVIAASLVIALGINFIVIDGTNIGQSLKTSVLNSQGVKIDSDIFLEKNDDGFQVVTSKNIGNIQTLTLSFAYNSENISIDNFKTENAEIVNLDNTPGINSIIINFKEATNIDVKGNILQFDFHRKNNKSENINIMNANFTDNTGETYLLSTSGLTF
ncbi:hypothetical protein A9Q91_03755 [Candidatus Gracilibacteria bacterium 28_42_T64]|nr:hypothetical protein A9Q91_03755 [Candidatus Gracilibacteria bacterium 28_42_T64]